MRRTAVLNVVGLTQGLIGDSTPRIRDFARRGRMASIIPAFPAVTCTAQANYLTGQKPGRHGIVGNGWFDRELAEVHFWKQSNRLVQAPKVWEEIRRRNPEFTCAKLFWWYNMYSSADFSITPRPAYPADGRKVFDIYTAPSSVRPEIKGTLGEFPFPAFWGPAAGVGRGPFAPDAASQWIAQSGQWIEERFRPTLALVYLPHLDYNLQRLGPGDPRIKKDLREMDAIVGDLLEFYASRSVQVLILSEYGITPVSRPVHLNRLFREKGWLALREELGLELLDCGASRVFAVADHQVAHIYLNDLSLEGEVRRLLESTTGVEMVLGLPGKREAQLDHARAGDLVVASSPEAWFTYYYWMEDERAPDFARTVDIHRKPGYDPVELFLDPARRFIQLRILRRLLQKRLGFRMLMDVIPLDAHLVKGSHGRVTSAAAERPVLIGESALPITQADLDSTEVYSVILNSVCPDSRAGQP